MLHSNGIKTTFHIFLFAFPADQNQFSYHFDAALRAYSYKGYKERSDFTF